MKKTRELLKEMGYEEEVLNAMSDTECEAELQEVPYNV